MNLLITLDYELFGDGSGDVFTHMINPTNQILKACAEFDIKLTIFVEIIEYLKLKEQWEDDNTMGYSKNPIKAIKNQIRAAAEAGHDIQLHIHPQWINAKYLNDKWHVDFSNWRLGSFKTTNGFGISELIALGKTELEKIVTLVDKDYKCIAIRAGGYNIMPSTDVYKTIEKLGMKVDSSIYSGGIENGKLSSYDYSSISNNIDYWWADKNDIRNASKDKQILEIPIFAMQIPRWKKFFTIEKVLSIINQKKGSVSALTKEKTKNISFAQKVKYLIQKESTPWDICVCSRSLNKHFFKMAENTLSTKRQNIVVVGHPKSLSNKNTFENFLEINIQRKQPFKFKTIKELYDEVR
ncbi:polysaccharide deacetylase family protein [Saccharicrinis aurantiacus]|uniref:hypothetical protein n=1 Tax=Saccharicrinis aurantiacus TaxID=1849719 RepID=UPI00083892B0|nr:hypothetical protein [Saccharicrinis aurantiacus]